MSGIRLSHRRSLLRLLAEKSHSEQSVETSVKRREEAEI
jgi:hypothetical protein